MRLGSPVHGMDTAMVHPAESHDFEFPFGYDHIMFPWCNGVAQKSIIKRNRKGSAGLAAAPLFFPIALVAWVTSARKI